MEIKEWILHSGHDLIGSIGIIASLLFAAVSYRSEAKTRRVANLLAITSNHREIWKEFAHNPAVARVVDPLADIINHPATFAEESFVTLVISHMNSAFEAVKDDLLIRQEGFRRDAREFLSLPIPSAVWSKTKLLQNQDFAAFIDDSLKS